MMFGKKGLVFDIETSGLLSDVKDVWCISFKDMATGRIDTLRDERLNRDAVLDKFTTNIGRPIIGHNIINFDYEILKMFYGIDVINLFGIESTIDTYLVSKTLYPDRPMPKGCPTSIRNKVLKVSKKIGPHGLESWGWRMGERKVEIHEWRIFDESIIERCEVDVSITEKVYRYLMKEAGIEMEV